MNIKLYYISVYINPIHNNYGDTFISVIDKGISTLLKYPYRKPLNFTSDINMIVVLDNEMILFTDTIKVENKTPYTFKLGIKETNLKKLTLILLDPNLIEKYKTKIQKIINGNKII